MRTFLSVLLVLLFAVTAFGTDNAISRIGTSTTIDIGMNTNVGIGWIMAEGAVTETLVVLDNETAARDTQTVVLAGPFRLNRYRTLSFWAFVDSSAANSGDTLDDGTYDLDSVWTTATETDTMRYALQESFNDMVDWTDVILGQDTVVTDHQTEARWAGIAPADSLSAHYKGGPWYRIVCWHNISIGDLGGAETTNTMIVRHRFGYKAYD